MAERKRLPTATAELYYDEYVQRRNKELAKSRPESKKSQRSVSSNPERPNSKSSRISTASSRKSTTSAGSGPKPYEFEAHEYKPKGYSTFNTQLGEDPVTAIRTLKSRLREMSISCATKDRLVKSQLCQQACDKLTEAEAQMGNLSHQRSQAILHGKVEDAKKISAKMNDLRDRVTYTAYTDLLLDKEQINSFGVKSTWVPSPEHSEPEEEQPKPKKKAEPKIREVRSLSARKQEREREEGKDQKIKAFRPLSAQKQTKRNVRLFGTVVDSNGKVSTENDPFRPADEYGKCSFCNEINGEFAREQFLKLHMSENCPCLTRCDYCDRIIEVQKLNEHQLNRCKFVNGELAPCSLCGLACYKGESSHPRCRRMVPPEDSDWCPLCSIAVKPKDSKEAWEKHLKKDCYNNPRKNLSGVPDPGWDYTLSEDVAQHMPVNNDGVKPGANNRPGEGSADYPVDPNAPYDQQYIYAQAPVNAESIREAFEKIKEERKAETERMRQDEAKREKLEEELAEKEAKRLEKEVEKIKKKREEEKKKKK